MIKTIALLLGFAVSAVVAMQVASFFERDCCMDAGGRIEATTGACVLEEGTEYVPLFSRPGLYAFWAVFTAVVFIPGWAVFWLIQKMLGPTTRSSATAPPSAGPRLT